MKNKKVLTLKEVKEFLFKNNFIIKKNNKNSKTYDLRSVYLTSVSSLLIIGFFISLPMVINFKTNYITSSKEIKNNSKSNFKKILDGDTLGESTKSLKTDKALNLKNLFDDVFTFDDLPVDTVRLSASTIEQLFKDTNYTLEDVRKTKLVKPVSLSLLPEEMKMIESIKKRKNLFIQIILPLILE